MQAEALVLYDSDCSSCRSLAAFMATRGCREMQFMAWQSFREKAEFATILGARVGEASPSVLRLWTGTVLLEDKAAWTALLTMCTQLKSLTWLAGRLGLTEDSTASMVMRAAGIVRRFCSRCGKRS